MIIEILILTTIIIILNAVSNQAISTIPFQKNILTPIKCKSCETEKKFFEYFYLINFFKNKNSCTSCNTKFNKNRILLEIYTIFIGNILAYLFNYNLLAIDFILTYLIFHGLITLSFIDLEHFGIPDSINLPTLYLSFGLLLQKYDILLALEKVGVIIGISLVLAYTFEMLLKRPVIGEGDLIVFGTMLGLLTETKYVFVAIFVGCVSALLIILIKKIILKTNIVKIQFVPYLTIGTIITYIYGEELIKIWVR